MADFGSPNQAYTPVRLVDSTGTPISSGGEVASGGTDSGNPVKIGGVYRSTLPTFTNGQRGDVQIGTRGAMNVQIMARDGTLGLDVVNSAGGEGTGNAINTVAVRAFPHLWNGSTWDRQRKSISTSRLPASANSNNATVVKASAGDVFTIIGLNATAGVKYLKLYNKATAPAPGTDNALLMAVFALAASSPFSFQLAASGLYFATGIGFALVTGASDTDNTSVAANDILGLNLLYH